MKKILFLFFSMFLTSNSYAEFIIDPTAIQQLTQLINLLQQAREQVAQLKGDVKQNGGTKLNTASLIEIQTKIEDKLRDSDEYVKIAFSGLAYSDIESLKKLGTNLKGKFASNLNTSTWKISDLTPYLDGNTYGQTSGSDFLDKLTAGVSLDNKGTSTTIASYMTNSTDYMNRIYALQSSLQKKKVQQALTYYKMADELEKKASALSSAVSKNSGGSAFTLQNKGIFGMIDSGGDGILGSILNSSDIFGGASTPSFGSNSTVTVGDMTYMVDVTGKVYDQNGKYITTDLSFGVQQLALQQADGRLKSLFTGEDADKKAAEILFEREGALYEYNTAQKQNAITDKIIQGAISQATSSSTTSVYNPQVSDIGFGSKAGLRMTTGDRIIANDAAMNLLNKAQEYREKGDALLLEALKKTPEQKAVEVVWQNQLFRTALSKITL